MSFKASDLLPNPLNQPEKWPTRADQTAILIPLDIAASSAGLLRDYFLKLAQHQSCTYVINDSAFREATLSAAILKDEVDRWIARATDFKSVQSENYPLHDWLNLRLPEFSKTIGEIKLRSLLHEYVKEFPEAESTGLNGLRYFTGFLRSRKIEPALLDLALIDEAFFNVVNSDPNLMGQGSGFVSLPAVIEIVRLQGADFEQPVLAVYTDGQRIKTLKLGWQESAIADVFDEGPVSQTELSEKLQSFNIQRATLKLGPGRYPSFEIAIAKLFECGFLRYV